MEARCGARGNGCNDAVERGELVHVVELLSHRIHVVGQVIDIVPHVVVRLEECLDIPPRALERFRMSPVSTSTKPIV